MQKQTSSEKRMVRNDEREVAVKTGAHLFLKLMQSKGVDFIFGTTGGGMSDLQDAMVVVKPPKWIQGLHEFTTVCAATGYALASGKPGIAMVDRSVGTQNSVGGFYLAFTASAPVVAFASSNTAGVLLPTGDFPVHNVHHQAHFLAPWIKWFTYVESIDSLPEDVDKAIYLASSEQKGPVYVALPSQLMAQEISSGRLTKSEYPLPIPRVPTDQDAERIVDEILRHQDPTIVVSNIGRNPESVGALVDFAHIFGCPVFEGGIDFMNYPRTDDMHLGFVATHRGDESGEKLSSTRVTWPKLDPQTDLAIALELGAKPHARFEDRVDVIDITSDPLRRQDKGGGDYGSSLYPAMIRAVCDAGPALQKLVKIGQNKISKSDREAIAVRTERISSRHKKLKEEQRVNTRRSYDNGKLDHWSIAYILNKYWPQNGIWVDGTFSFKTRLTPLLDLDRPGSLFSNTSGHMGGGVGMAYGVALAQRNYIDVKYMGSYAVGRLSKPVNPVIAAVGDGESFMGNITSALWSCAHYGLGVLYLVLNNASWAAELHLFEYPTQQWTIKAKDYECVDIDEPRPDFTSIARAFKVHANAVDSVEQFERSLQKSLQQVSQGHPSLLEVNLPKFTGTKSVVL